MRFSDIKPRAKYFLCLLIPSLLVPLSLTSCIYNSQFKQGSETEEMDEEDIVSIMKKYDADFEASPYTGKACNISLVHWDGDGQSIEMSVLNTMLKGFKKRYPTISVSLTILSDYESSYSTRLTGNDIADVFLMPDGDVNQWVELGQCEPLDDYIASSTLLNLEEIYPTATSRYVYDFNKHVSGQGGTTIALPKDIGPMVMYYNKSAFKKAGLPYPSDTEIMSMDDAFKMWTNLKQKDSKGNISMYGVGGLSIEGLVWSAGGDFLNAERNAFPTDPNVLAGLKKGYEQMQKSYVIPKGATEEEAKYCCVQPPASWTNGADDSKLFSNQMLACYIGLKSKVAAFRKLDFDWDVCPVPSNSVYPTKNAWSGSVGYSMWNKSKNKEAAWKLIEYIDSKEGQELLSATGFQIPIYPELASQEDYLERESNNLPANFKCFLNAAEKQPIGLWSYHSNTLWKSEGFDKYVEKVFAAVEDGQITVDSFLNTTKTAVNQLLQK